MFKQNSKINICLVFGFKRILNDTGFYLRFKQTRTPLILRGAYTENPDQSYKGTQSFRKLCFRWVMKLWKSHFQILLASSKNENGTIDYNKFDSLVNYQSSPARAATAEDHAPRMSKPKGKFLAFFQPEPKWLFWNGLNFEIFDENVKRHSIIRRCRL